MGVIVGFRWDMGGLEGRGSAEEASMAGLGDAGCRVQWRGTGRSLAPQGSAPPPFHFQPPTPALCVTRSFLTLGEPTGCSFTFQATPSDPMSYQEAQHPCGASLPSTPALRVAQCGDWRTSHHHLRCHPGPLQGPHLEAGTSTLGGAPTSHDRSQCPGLVQTPVAPGGLVTVGSAGRPS